MPIIILLFSFLINVNASDRDTDISVGRLLGGFSERFSGERLTLPQLHERSENIVTVRLRKVQESTDAPGLLSLCTQLQGKGSERLIQTFNVHDPHHALMNGHEFSPASREHTEALQFTDGVSIQRVTSGTRAVVIYTYAGRRVCLKQWPEAPGIEIAAYQVYKELLQGEDKDIPLPPAEMIMMNRQVFLVLDYMEGESFADVLTKDPTPRVFNQERLHKLALFYLLAVPDDAGARNCLLRQIPGSSEWEIRSIDNERDFGKPHTESYHHPKKGVISTRCHCVLFCFYEMLAHPIAESVLGPVMTSKRNILLTWQRLIEENSYQLALTQYVRDDGGDNKSLLGIPFNEAAIISMLTRVNAFIKLMAEDKNRTLSLASIFWEVCPELAATYKIPKDMRIPESVEPTNLKDVLERICDIEPSRAPGAKAPDSAYFPIYRESTNVNLEMLFNILTWVHRNCDTLDEREKADTLKAIEAIQMARTAQSAEAAIRTLPDDLQKVAGALIQGVPPQLQRTIEAAIKDAMPEIQRKLETAVPGAAPADLQRTLETVTQSIPPGVQQDVMGFLRNFGSISF